MLQVIVSLMFSVIASYVVYRCLEEYGFKTTVMIRIVYMIVAGIINTGFYKILGVICVGVILGTIETAIDTIIYKKTNNFKTFFIFSMLVGIAIPVILGIIISVGIPSGMYSIHK